MTKFIIQVSHNYGTSYLVLGDKPEDSIFGCKKVATRFNTKESAERAIFLVDKALLCYRRLIVFHIKVIKDES